MMRASASLRNASRRGRDETWHVRARWGASLFLLAVAIIARIGKFIDTFPELLLVVAGMALANLLLMATRWLERQPRRTTLVFLLLDVVALTVYFHYSGDIENPLMIAYCLPVVAAALLVSKRAAFLIAGCAWLLFMALVAFTAVDALPVHLPHHHLDLMHTYRPQELIDPDTNPEGWNYIVAHLGSLAAVLVGCAYGFGTLADRIRETNQALESENQRFALLLNILPEGVVLLGPNGSVLLANPTARLLVPELERADVRAVDPALDIAARLQRFAEPVESFETNSRDRILHHMLARGTAATPIVWLIQDLTRERRLTAQVMHFSKMVDLGLLAAGIAHEIGNPLSSMSAIIDIIEIKQAAPAIVERLRALRSHVDRIHRIVRDITSFARPSVGKRQRTRVQALLDKALQIFRLHEKGREMMVQQTGDASAVVLEVVEDQVVQVLLNLLLNAADASSGHGRVEVYVAAAGASCSIQVIDHGMGMNDETLRRLFTPFFTTKDQGKGVGLGLFLSECIVRDLGGRIDVQSTPGSGRASPFTCPWNRWREIEA
ncbi:MAG: ATP-binding protein [Planctomycetota bacterium]